MHDNRGFCGRADAPAAPPGDWQAYFPAGDEAALSALVARSDGAVPPHQALLIAFLRLLERPQARLNEFTARHLQVQMREVLGFVPRPPQPDRVHLVIEPKKGAAAFELNDTHRFNAGKDARKVEQHYVPVRPVVITPARVARLAGVARDGEHLLVTGAEDPAEITRVLAGHGLYVRELTPIRPDLESAFLSLTADEGLGSEADRDAGGLTTGGAA